MGRTEFKRKSDFMIAINTIHDLVAEVQALQEEQERLMAEMQKLRSEKQVSIETKVLPKQLEQPKQETVDSFLAYFLLRK